MLDWGEGIWRFSGAAELVLGRRVRRCGEIEVVELLGKALMFPIHLGAQC